MNSHQLHTLAARISTQERITHAEACARLARRPRRNRVTVKPDKALAAVERPGQPYWWQRD